MNACVHACMHAADKLWRRCACRAHRDAHVCWHARTHKGACMHPTAACMPCAPPEPAAPPGPDPLARSHHVTARDDVAEPLVCHFVADDVNGLEQVVAAAAGRGVHESVGAGAGAGHGGMGAGGQEQGRGLACPATCTSREGMARGEGSERGREGETRRSASWSGVMMLAAALCCAMMAAW